MNFYYADKDYCNYLHLIENKVSIIDGKKEKRPFLGIVMCVNYKNYFAPLTSPKPKHLNMKDTTDFIRIDKGNLGAINLNNMIPIPKIYLYKIEISNIKDEKYAHLLNLQGTWCKYNTQRITKQARRLYFNVKSKKEKQEVINRCCNFEELEEKCLEYMNKNMIMEEEILYKFSKKA